MPRARIVQLLCPARHCILALAYDSLDGEPLPEMASLIQEQFAKGPFPPYCELCRSRSLYAEDAALKFSTLAEAMPFLMESHRQQLATRQFVAGQARVL